MVRSILNRYVNVVYPIIHTFVIFFIAVPPYESGDTITLTCPYKVNSQILWQYETTATEVSFGTRGTLMGFCEKDGISRR